MNSEPIVDPDADIWAELREDGGQYIELHPAPYKSVLDGRFSLAQLEAIVRRLQAMNTRIADEREQRGDY